MHRPFLVQKAWLTCVLALLLASAPAMAKQAHIAFTTKGGDAWTFRKAIEADVVHGRCDKISIASVRSSKFARPRAGHLRARLRLGPGHNRIVAKCYEAGRLSGSPIVQDWDVRLPDVPTAWIRTSVLHTPTKHASVMAGRIVLDGRASARAPGGKRPIVAYDWRAAPGNPAPLRDLPARGPRIVLRAPIKDGEYRVILTVTDAAGRRDESTGIFRVRNGRPESIDLTREHPAWIQDAVIYGVVPNLFGKDGLPAVARQLDRLSMLGVNTLWLSPVTDAPSGDFGYAATDLFKVREGFGGDQALRALVGAAHARGMHVILDFVSNDLSDRHPYFADAAENGRASPYYDFFQRTAAGTPAHYFDWRNLENLNYRNPEVRRLVIEAFAYWVRRFHVDGFRVDAAWGVRLRDPGFWPRWRAALKRIDPDLLLLAEAPARDTYYVSHGFDAAYDWTDALGQWAWQSAFDDPSQTVPRLEAAIAADPGPAVFRFLDNNDTGPRFVTRYGVARTRVAAAMLMTLPGLPGLYAGDEVGAAYEPYKAPGTIVWRDPDGLQSWYRDLIALRRREPALRSGLIDFVDTGSDVVLGYLRSSAAGRDRILVLLNYASTPSRAVVHATPALPPDASLTDLLSGQRISAADAASGIALEGHAIRIMKILETARRGASTPMN